jgi:hypothetical protein
MRLPLSTTWAAWRSCHTRFYQSGYPCRQTRSAVSGMPTRGTDLTGSSRSIPSPRGILCSGSVCPPWRPNSNFRCSAAATRTRRGSGSGQNAILRSIVPRVPHLARGWIDIARGRSLPDWKRLSDRARTGVLEWADLQRLSFRADGPCSRVEIAEVGRTLSGWIASAIANWVASAGPPIGDGCSLRSLCSQRLGRSTADAWSRCRPWSSSARA